MVIKFENYKIICIIKIICENMKTVALILIKLGLKRVQRKNIKPFFDSAPLMYFVQKICVDAKNIDQVSIANTFDSL